MLPPGAEEEIPGFMEHARAVCAEIAGHEQAWVAFNLPYAPLWLEARKLDPQSSDDITNFGMGIAIGACRRPETSAPTSFFCPEPCLRERLPRIRSQLDEYRTLVARFRKLPVHLLAQWFVLDYRVDDVIVRERPPRPATEAIPSPKLGLVPSGQWRTWPTAAAVFTERNWPHKEIAELAELMRNLPAVALVRETRWVRVVVHGYGDDQLGLLFVDRGAPPRAGELLAPGHELVFVEKLTGGAYLFGAK